MKLDCSIKILILEDNQRFTDLLLIMLQEIGMKKVQIAESYDMAIELFDQHNPDLCILDIDLGPGHRNGIEVAEYIRDKDETTPVIFLTSNYTEEYYYKSRHVKPIGFMNKELSRFKLQQAIDLALLNRIQAPPPYKISDIGNAPSGDPPLINKSHFFFKIGDNYKAIPIKDVSYFYADQKFTYARIGDRNYPTTVLLKTLEDEFPEQFVRIHKTYLVNFNYIESIVLKENSVIITGDSLPIGLAYRKQFMSRLQLLK